MRSTRRGILVLAFSALAAHGADLSFVAVGPTTISAGQTVRIEVLVNGIALPDALRGYQATMEIVPANGTVGSLGLVDPVTPDPNNNSIRVDTSRMDWVFATVPGSTFAVANPLKLQIGATVFDPGHSVTVGASAYCGEYVLTPSADALGDFQINFQLLDPQAPQALPTFLLHQDGTFISFVDTGLTVTVVPPSVEPPNNDCVNRTPLSEGVTALDTENATTDGVPLDVTCDEGNGVAMGQDVWFDYIASCTGIATLDTCGNANFDTWLAVYGDGSSTCSCPADNTGLLSCSDNAAGCALGTSRVSLAVTQGSCYTIRAGGAGVAEGLGSLSLTCAPDLCANAVLLSAGSTTPGTTENTSVNDAIGPDCGTGPVTSPGVWYKVSGTGGLMTVSLRSGATFNTRLTVYEGGCGALSCVGDADVLGNGNESISWCSAPGTEYLVLVHGSGGATGAFSLDVSSRGCGDGDACTDDSCSAGLCLHVLNFDDVTFCCEPATRALTAIDDGNPCTDDVCNAVTGVVSHPARPSAVEPACDDALTCTLDECQGGLCTNTDINTIPCTQDAQCPGDTICGDGTGDTQAGFCHCVVGPPLELIVDPGSLPVSSCFAAPNEIVTVRVVLGAAERNIVGIQFFVEYDAATLEFVNVTPGATVDPASPFALEFNRNVDPFGGTIDYVVAANFGQPTMGPATAAVITFRTVAECSSYVRFRPIGPSGQVNKLSAEGGVEIDPTLVDAPVLIIDGAPPTLSACPVSAVVSADPGLFASAVSWNSLSASDTCDGAVTALACNPPSGSVFSAGTTPVTCLAADSCGLTDQCSFNITVEPSLLTADLELSSTVAAGPFLRCITFDLWDCAAPGGAIHASVSETVSFVNGVGSVVDLPIPGGQWSCLSARDDLHTLRSTATDFGTIDGRSYTATFVGSRSTGGHWLLGGNLNGDNYIDILDFGVFFSFFLTQATPNAPCGAIGPDPNINGDAVVDLLDLVFIAGNSLQSSEPSCCAPGGVAAFGDEGPVLSITVPELRARGLGHLIAADVNRDGVLDRADVVALIQDGPPSGSQTSLRELLQNGAGGQVRARDRAPRR